MSGTLDDRYLTWLYSQVGSVKLKNPARTYWVLFRHLYKREFVWLVPNDHNRVEDGKDLRWEFLEGEEVDDSDWLNLGCSMLEMLIALSRRLNFETDKEPEYWFWKLLNTLGLDVSTDKSQLSSKQIDDIIDVVVWRTYDKNGNGGLFPLTKNKKDQRGIEIWYQLSAYILENE